MGKETYLYKFLARMLITISLIAIVLTLLMLVNIFHTFENIRYTAIAIFVFFIPLYFPGKYYLNATKNTDKPNKLNTAGLIFVTLGMISTIGTFIWAFLECPTGCDGWGGMLLAIGSIPVIIFYGTAIILFIINKVKSKK